MLIVAAAFFASLVLSIQGKPKSGTAVPPPGPAVDQGEPKSGSAVPHSNPAVDQIASGSVPENLEQLTDPAVIDALSRRLRSDRPWKSEEDRRRALRHLCAHARPADVDLLYSFVRSELTGDAYFAVFALADLADSTLLRQMEEDLPWAEPPLLTRFLDLLARCPKPQAARLVRLLAPFLLNADEIALSKSALGALATHRVQAATSRILDLWTDSDDDRLSDRCLRALGWIWDTPMDAPPDPEHEELRLQALLAAHRITMSGAATEDSCTALLRIMNQGEFEDFLGKHAGDRFPQRRLFAKVSAEPTFDRQKGGALHTALLGSPDVDLVAELLLTSPHTLPVERIADFLSDDRLVEKEDYPENTTLAECAAVRLANQVDGLPDAKADRRKLVELQKARNP